MREYNYRVNSREEGRKFWFQFQNDRVTFADLNTSLNLMKRSKLVTAQSFPRPSKVLVIVDGPQVNCLYKSYKRMPLSCLRAPCTPVLLVSAPPCHARRTGAPAPAHLCLDLTVAGPISTCVAPAGHCQAEAKERG